MAHPDYGAHHDPRNNDAYEAQNMFCPQCGGEAGQLQPFCKFCGAKLTWTEAESPPKRKRYSFLQRTGLVLVIVFGLLLWHVVHPDFGRDTLQNVPSKPTVEVQHQTQGPSSDTSQSTQQNAVSPPIVSVGSPPASSDEAISVEATNLLAAYQADEKTATARYENRKVAVTGVLSGVFIPSLNVLMRAGWDFHPSAFVTMGGPHPASVEETLFLPGVKAYSESSSLFGQQDTRIADHLTVGETVTLVCTLGDAFKVSGLRAGSANGNSGYSVTLKDCKMQDNAHAVEPKTPPRDQNDPVDTYQPCLPAMQHLQVPQQIDLDLPHDFSPAVMPPPQFTFLFSEHGIDVYAVVTNKFGPAGYDRLALLVFQDDKVRREILRSYIASGLVVWAYSDEEDQDWKPIVNFKYVTLDFSWFQRREKLEPSVSSVVLYAPPECDSVSEPAGARPSSMIGVYISKSPSDLPEDSLIYRAAEALRKFQMQERSK
ncbi:MAG: hypothetical protein WCD43_10290 [Candidatus Acidiferrales bacterium]